MLRTVVGSASFHPEAALQPSPAPDRTHMSKGYRLTASTGIHKGDRDYQQDRVALLNHPRANGCIMGIVADGMGGERSGELAGKVALDNITRLLPRAHLLSEGNLSESAPQILKGLYSSIHQELVRLGTFDPLCINMGATLTMVWIHRSMVMFAHVGDTRLYRIRKNEGS